MSGNLKNGGDLPSFEIRLPIKCPCLRTRKFIENSKTLFSLIEINEDEQHCGIKWTHGRLQEWGIANRIAHRKLRNVWYIRTSFLGKDDSINREIWIMRGQLKQLQRERETGKCNMTLNRKLHDTSPLVRSPYIYTTKACAAARTLR